MRKALPIALALLAVAATACSKSSGVAQSIPVRGEVPVTSTTSTTSTTIALPTTTLPANVATIPDTTTWKIRWNHPIQVDPATGKVNVLPYNAALFRAKATHLTPEQAVALFLGLDPTDPNVQMLVGHPQGPESTTITVVDLTNNGAERAVRYVFTVQEQPLDSLKQSQAETEQAAQGFEGTAAQAASSGAQSVVMTNGQVAEEINSQGSAKDKLTVPFITSAYWSTQCQPNQGHQDFTLGTCA
jgi:hypothetical protein